MSDVKFTAKIDGACWSCGKLTIAGVDTIVRIAATASYVCESCYVPYSNTKRQCTATTQSGWQCPNDGYGEKSLCHLHDPAKQCGFKKKNGSLCRMATGGRGYCRIHKRIDERA